MLIPCGTAIGTEIRAAAATIVFHPGVIANTGGKFTMRSPSARRSSRLNLRSCLTAVLIAAMPQAMAWGAEAPNVPPPDETVRLGVRAYNGVEAASKRWGPTADALGLAIPGYTFELVPIVAFDAMRAAVEIGAVDFVLTNPMAYAELEANSGVSRMATLRNGRFGGGFTDFACVVFARADRNDIVALGDVRGRSIMGVDPEAFGGWLMALRELKDLGIDPFDDCSEVQFSPDGTQEAVVRAVLGGTVDIGVVRTSIIEGMVERGELDAAELKILDPAADDLPLPHSTRCYPEWAFASLHETPAELAQRVAIALLSMAPDDPAALAGAYTGWTIPLSYNPVHELMLEMRVGPYQETGHVTLGQAIRQHWVTVSMIAVAVIVLTLIAAYVLGLNRRLRLAQADLLIHQEHLERIVDHRTAELRASVDRFVAVFEKAPMSYQSLDEQGDLIEVNETWCKVLGFTRKEVVGRNFTEFLQPDFRDRFRERFPQFKSRGTTQDAVFGMVKKDGTEIIASLDGKIEYTSEGSFKQTHCVLQDITERMRAEGALRQSERLLLESQDVAQIGSYLLDIASGAWKSSPTLDHIFGIDVEYERSVDGWLALIHPDDRQSMADYFARDVLAAHGRFDKAYRILRHDNGIERWVQGLGKLEFDESGRLLHMIGTIQDITERKRTEDVLHKYEHIVSSSGDMLALLDQDYVYLAVNQAYLAPLGKSVDEVIGRTVTEVFDGAFFNSVIKPRAERCLAGEDVRYQEWFVFPVGGRRYLDVTYSPHIGMNSEIQGFVFAARDITEREELQAQLLQAQKMESIGRLAGGVAHDFNNMLGVILGHTELALQQMDPALPIFADLEQIRTAAERSANLTRQLLGFARKQTIDPRVLDLNETVGGMLKMLHRIIGEDIEFAWLPGAEPLPVKLDPSQIDQILANLLINARDAIDDVGKVAIETGCTSFDEAYCAEHPGCSPGEYVLLKVSDDGRGMDKETLDRLYEPFYTTKKVGKGTGLGLAMVYGIVKQNGGFINVHSEPGRGTAFKIHLPRHAALPIPAGKGSPAKEVQNGHETVLLVEDEPSILRLITRMLELDGYTVLAAGAPGEAISLAQARPGGIQLLITDVIMPEMNGRELNGKLSPHHPNLKCLFMSGYPADVIAHHGVLDEGVHFLQKPFTRLALAEEVRKALDGR